MEVVGAGMARCGVVVGARGGEEPLPGPLATGLRVIRSRALGGWTRPARRVGAVSPCLQKRASLGILLQQDLRLGLMGLTVFVMSDSILTQVLSLLPQRLEFFGSSCQDSHASPWGQMR